MRKKLMLLAAFAPLAFAQTTVSYTFNGLPVPIYPDDWDVISVVRLYVPRSIVINNVTASVQVQYSGAEDLNIYLYSPIGTRTKLLERNCGSLTNIDTTFDDAAPQMFNQVCPQPGSAPYRGNEPLANSQWPSST